MTKHPFTAGNEQEQVDLAIVGAGLVGASLALALAKAHPALQIGLIEASSLALRPSLEGFDSRVVALNTQSQQLLQALGVWEAVAQIRVCPYFAMEVWDGEGTGAVSFDAALVHAPNLGHIVESRVLLSCLHEALLQCPNVTWLTPNHVHTLTSKDRGIEVGLDDGRVVNAQALVGADGAHSKVRELMGFKVRQWSYEQSAMITTVKTQKPHGFVARQSFTHCGPLAFLPLTQAPVGGSRVEALEGFYSSIVWSVDDERLESLTGLTDAAFCEALTRAFEGRLGDVTWTDERHVIPLQQRHVTAYADGCVTLVGDAAHTIHPLAGQGVNVGLRDIKILAKEIGRAIDRKVPLNHPQTFQRFARQAEPHNLLAMGAMEGFKRVFGGSNPWLRLARNQALTLASNHLLLKRQLVQWAAGVDAGME